MPKTNSPDYGTQESTNDLFVHLEGGATADDMAKLRKRDENQKPAGTITHTLAPEVVAKFG
jgi:hypothetical protein